MEGCKKDFLCKLNLEAHKKSHDREKINETDKICLICDKKFTHVWLKNQHDEIKHKGNEIFKCSFENCAKSFTTSSKLQRHTKIHLKIKEFKCEFSGCTATFHRREHLSKHSQVHLTTTTNNTYLYCDYPSNLLSIFINFF